MDLRADLENGKTVYMIEHVPVSYMDADRASLGGDTVTVFERPPTRIIHWYWPVTFGEGEVGHAIVAGELTAAKKELAERRAYKAVSEAGIGAEAIIWRVLPEWASDTDFESGTKLHRLYLRGSFVFPETTD